jgi:IclR family acetate operon transcriptional repressor
MVQHAIVSPETASEPRGNGIQSVRRAASLLRAFGTGAPELGVSELGRRLNLHKSTVSRLLATLESEGLLERAPGTEKYRLGPEFARLAGRADHFGDVREVARPFLVELAELTRETANLAVLDGDEVNNVDQVSGPHLVRVGNWVGRRTPLHCVANGKALLAFLPKDEMDRLTAGPLAAFTPLTITRPAALRAALAQVRQQGYATALGEIEEGLNAIAAPIWDADDTMAAAISVSGPAYRVTPQRVPELGQITRDFARRVSNRMGYQESK